jgi:hypothetical protein
MAHLICDRAQSDLTGVCEGLKSCNDYEAEVGSNSAVHFSGTIFLLYLSFILESTDVTVLVEGGRGGEAGTGSDITK